MKGKKTFLFNNLNDTVEDINTVEETNMEADKNIISKSSLNFFMNFRYNIKQSLYKFIKTVEPKEGETENMLYLYGDICEWLESLGAICHRIKEENEEKE